MNSDSKIKQNHKEIINVNNIFFEDSFIDLINSLNNNIKELYRNSKLLITSSQQSLIQFGSTISNLLSLSNSNSNKIELNAIIDDLNSVKENYNQITIGSSNNIEIFVEKAKKIFQEMKTQKDNKLEEIYNDYTKRHTLKNNKNNNQFNINTEPIRKSNPLHELKRNKTLTKNNCQNKTLMNINLVKNLINQLGEFNNLIIKNHSNTDWENFNKIQKQILSEINKSFNSNSSKSVEGKGQKKSGGNKTETVEKNPFIMVNNNNNNVTMTTTNNNSYYNIIDKDNIKEINSASFHSNNKTDLSSDINILNNKNSILEKNLKEKEEEMAKMKEDYELKYKLLNDKNTSLSKDLVNKNHEIQILQNSNKLKISEITKLKLIVKNNEKQLKVQKAKVEQLREKSPGNIKIKDLLGNKKDVIENKNLEEKMMNKEQIKKLEEEIEILKDTINKKDENVVKLEKDLSEINIKNKQLNDEINFKDNKMNNSDMIINNLKSEKEKLINKIKDNKSLEQSFKIQIDTLKLQIKEMERQQKEYLESDKNKSDKKKDLKNQNNELKFENMNLKFQLEYELNFNKQLKADVKTINEENEGLKLVIDKLIKEKELFVLNKEINEEIKNKMNSIKRINTDSGHKMEIEENSNKKIKNEKSENNINYNKEKEKNKSTEIKKNLINK